MKRKLFGVSEAAGGFDADAQAFITAAGITDGTQQTAINTLVIGLKADSLWTKMKAVYTFVGGTADTHKWNLKDPRDLDAAFRITWNGTTSHSSNGYLASLDSGYGDTHLQSNLVLSQNDKHLSYYSLTNVGGTPGGDIGSITFSTGFDGLNCMFNNKFYAYLSENNFIGITHPTPSTFGYFLAARNNGTQVNLYKNGSDLTTNPIPSISQVQIASNIMVGGYIATRSSRDCAFSTIGDGLDATDQSNLYTLVQAFNTTLSRQV